MIPIEQTMTKIYHSLESEKYLLAALKGDKESARRQARANVKTMVINMVIAIVSTAVGFYLIKTMPEWLPVVQNAFHQLTNYKYV